MSIRRWAVAAALIISGVAAYALLQSPRPGPEDGGGLRPDDIERVRVGDAAPDFTLEAVDGRPVTLSSFRGSKFVILVFYRGHW